MGMTIDMEEEESESKRKGEDKGTIRSRACAKEWGRGCVVGEGGDKVEVMRECMGEGRARAKRRKKDM